MTENEPTDNQLKQIREGVEQRAAVLAGLGPSAKKEELPLVFVRQCLNSGELGDGLLFAEIHRGRFCYCATSQLWLCFDQPVWLEDLAGRAEGAVEKVATEFDRLLQDTNERIKALRTTLTSDEEETEDE